MMLWQLFVRFGVIVGGAYESKYGDYGAVAVV